MEISAMKLLHRHGFTLVELMIALAIGSIVTAGIYSAYTGQQRINQAQDQIVEMQQNLRAGLDMMAREIKMAGFDPDGTASVGFSKADQTEMTFSMRADGDGRDNDGDGERDEEDEYTGPGDVTQIRYDFNVGYSDTDGIRDIRRSVGLGNPIVLIANVDNVEFLYTLAGGGPPRLNLTPDDLSNIRSVTISVLARASGPSLKYTDNQTYTTASGVSWGPYNDNIRRRMQIKSVDCRNM